MSLEEKRQKLAEIKRVGTTVQVTQASPEEARFLPRVFQTTLKEWAAGYEDGLLLINPPPTIEVPSAEDPTKTERKFGPVPKIDPDFLITALNGYSAAKLHSNQTMTTWDHHFRNWMQVTEKKKKSVKAETSEGKDECDHNDRSKSVKIKPDPNTNKNILYLVRIAHPCGGSRPSPVPRHGTSVR